MGFARRVVRKSVRKATPRTVRRAMHPVRTAKNAVTPRPIKQVGRAVYTATNPLGAAENALIGAALYPRSGRGSRRQARPASGGARTAQTGPTAAEMRRAEGIASADSLSRITDLSREKFTPVRRPSVPGAPRLDPAPYAAVDWAARRGEVRFWQRRLRRDIQAEGMAAAMAFVEEQAKWSERDRGRRQAVADRWGAALEAGDPAVTRDSLIAAFSDNAARVTVVAVESDHALALLHLPTPDCLPDRMPHVTPGGKVSSRAWPKTDFNQVYAELLGAHLVATVREGFAVAPSVQRFRVVGLLTGAPAERSVLFDIECQRSASWASQDDGIRALSLMEGGLLRTGRTKEVTPWPPDRCPAELRAWTVVNNQTPRALPWLAQVLDPDDPKPTFQGSRKSKPVPQDEESPPIVASDPRPTRVGSPEGQAQTSNPSPGSPPADWYPDPYAIARLRYWDGNQWTSHTAG